MSENIQQYTYSYLPIARDLLEIFGKMDFTGVYRFSTCDKLPISNNYKFY